MINKRSPEMEGAIGFYGCLPEMRDNWRHLTRPSAASEPHCWAGSVVHQQEVKNGFRATYI